MEVIRPLVIAFRESVSAEEFLWLAHWVWRRSYSPARTAAALSRAVNVGAWHESKLVGSVRVLTGYCSPRCRGPRGTRLSAAGIGTRLIVRALEQSSRGALSFGAKPHSVAFFERIGCVRGPRGPSCTETQLGSLCREQPGWASATGASGERLAGTGACC
jgi:hypothetical protein